jgi:hypothetical protein
MNASCQQIRVTRWRRITSTKPTGGSQGTSGGLCLFAGPPNFWRKEERHNVITSIRWITQCVDVRSESIMLIISTRAIKGGKEPNSKQDVAGGVMGIK